MLGVLDDKGNDKAERVSNLKNKILDIAVKQINEHTELHISYRLEKKSKAFKNIIFTVKPQALADTIPFDLVHPGSPAPAGLQQHQVDNAGEHQKVWGSRSH